MPTISTTRLQTQIRFKITVMKKLHRYDLAHKY